MDKIRNSSTGIVKKLRAKSYRTTKKTKDFVLGVFIFVVLAGCVYTILAPIIGILSLSFMSTGDLFNPMVFVVPTEPTVYNISNAVRLMDYWPVLLHTLVYSLGMGLLHVLIASFVGYGFARFNFPGKKIIFALVLLTIIVPPQAYMTPLFMHMRFFGPTDINLINSYWSVTILTIVGMGLRSGLFIYIFRQFFKGLPVEINEAASIDGAGAFRTYATIILPNAKPAMITVLLLSLVWHYGDTFYSGMFLRETRFIHVAAQGIFSRYINEQGVAINVGDAEQLIAQMITYAGVLLVIAPMLVIYAFLQRYFIEGIERSGITG
ncbi:MAG: carbohydrate ABC transporter permease [Defluviitaleaceae bacterium]|nr:carbohydrate ABC transporter permease [Defluviitaleaceae bacterium]